MNEENIFTSSNFTAIELFNITVADAGVYSCTARSARFQRSDTIALSVSPKTKRMYMKFENV